MKKMVSFAVHQPNFCPWIGFFAKMKMVDIFVVLDDVQLPVGRSYVNRTKIISPKGESWLTVPLNKKSKKNLAMIKDVLISEDREWIQRHLNIIEDRYKNKRFFSTIFKDIESIYRSFDGNSLIDFNMRLIKYFADILEIKTDIIFSSSFDIEEKGDVRIAKIGKKIGARLYCSGSGGRNYQSPLIYKEYDINLKYLSFKENGEEEYPINIGFSIIDNIANIGPEGVVDFMNKMCSCK